jgi:hypothetical protein
MTVGFHVLGGFCCLYNKPFEMSEPWTCGQCGMIHGVRCKSEPAPDAPEHEMKLAESLARLNRTPMPRAWRQQLERWIVDESGPTTLDTVNAIYRTWYPMPERLP